MPLPVPAGRRSVSPKVTKVAEQPGTSLGPVKPSQLATIEKADKHIQQWRAAMVKAIFNIGLNVDAEIFRQIESTEGWRELKKAALDSTKVMAELRDHWNPEDKVIVRD